MPAPNQMQTFYPELNSRRGELIAWGSTVLVAIGWIILAVTGNRVPRSVPFLGILLLLAALSISLGNWMDRRTSLVLDQVGDPFPEWSAGCEPGLGRYPTGPGVLGQVGPACQRDRARIPF